MTIYQLIIFYWVICYFITLGYLLYNVKIVTFILISLIILPFIAGILLPLQIGWHSAYYKETKDNNQHKSF